MDEYTGAIKMAKEEDRFLLLVAYSANKMPLRGADTYIDLAGPEVLEKACWKFADNGMVTGLWHEPGHEKAARVVENYIYRNPEPWVIKGENGQPDQIIRQGDWVTGLILSKATWKLYKAGFIGGASPQGGAARIVATAETLERVRMAS
jgi:hypothetical protein